MAEKPINRLHWRRHCPGNHLASAADLSLEEDGVYLRLKDWAWVNGPIPLDIDIATRLIRAPRAKRKIVAAILERFFESRDGGFISPALEEERQEAMELVEKRREIGQRGGRKSQEKSKQLVDQMVNQRSTEYSTVRYGTVQHDTLSTDLSQEPDLNTTRESAARARRAAHSGLVVNELSSEVWQRLGELRPDLTSDEVRACVQKCSLHHSAKGIVREDWIPTLEDWVTRERPARGAKRSTDGEIFSVNGRTFVLRHNRAGERDNEHIALAKEIGVTSMGKQKQELEALLRARLERMSREQ